MDILFSVIIKDELRHEVLWHWRCELSTTLLFFSQPQLKKLVLTCLGHGMGVSSIFRLHNFHLSLSLPLASAISFSFFERYHCEWVSCVFVRISNCEVDAPSKNWPAFCCFVPFDNDDDYGKTLWNVLGWSLVSVFLVPTWFSAIPFYLPVLVGLWAKLHPSHTKLCWVKLHLGASNDDKRTKKLN